MKTYKVNTGFTASTVRNGTLSGSTRTFNQGDIVQLTLTPGKDFTGRDVLVTQDGYDVLPYLDLLTDTSILTPKNIFIAVVIIVILVFIIYKYK